jgi:hypothetical protein
MVEDIEILIDQAKRLAVSQYTRSAQRAKWTRLAGQLIWYKDQILRAMTWEALEQDVHRLAREQEEDHRRLERQSFVMNRTWAPTIIKKKDGEAEQKQENEDTLFSDNSDDSSKTAETAG